MHAISDQLTGWRLPKDRVHRMFWQNEEWKRELEQLTLEHSLISKFRQQRWYQYSRGMNEVELMGRYHDIVKVMEMLETDIADYEHKMYMHHVETEQVMGSMNPFKGIKIQDVTLVQTSLF